MMRRKGEAGVLGAVLIAFLIISAIATYVFISRFTDSYINTVNESIEKREQKSRERLEVKGYPSSKTIEITNVGDVTSHIIAFVILDNNTGKMTFYNSYNYTLTPMSTIKVTFNQMGEYPPYISGVITELGNIFWDEVITGESGGGGGNGIPSNVDNLALDFCSFDSWFVAGDHIAAMYLRDYGGDQHLILFNTTDGKIIAIDHVSSGDKLVKIYVVNFSDISIYSVYINGSPVELPREMNEILHIGYDYIILADYGQYMDIAYSNGSILEYEFTFSDEPKKDMVGSDIIIAKRDHYYRIRNGRVLYNKVVEKPELFTRGFILEPNNYVLTHWSTCGDWDTYEHQRFDHTAVLLVADDSYAPDTYNGYPSISPDEHKSGSGYNMYSFSVERCYLLRMITSDYYSSKYGKTYYNYYYFLRNGSSYYYYVKVITSFKRYDDYAKCTIKVGVYRVPGYEELAYKEHTFKNSYLDKGETGYYWYKNKVVVIMENVSDSTSDVVVLVCAWAKMATSPGGAGSDWDNVRVSCVFSYDDRYAYDAGFDTDSETDLYLYNDDPITVEVIPVGCTEVKTMLPTKLFYGKSSLGEAMSRMDNKMYVAFKPGNEEYNVHIYDMATNMNIGEVEDSYAPGLYITEDGITLSFVKNIPGMDKYGSPVSVLIYGDEVWAVYKVLNKLVFLGG